MAVYQSHPVFDLPSPTATIWRYMRFSKFIALLNSSALYFTVASRFEDKWEGTLPLQRKESIDARIISFFEQARATQAVNCWHLRENESAAMWKSYTQANEGIAIRSSVERLTTCFIEKEGTITFKVPVHIGKVKYVDYATESFESGNSFIPLLHKRSFFADEQELRAVIGGGFLSNFFVQGLHGTNVPVDLNILIEEIYVDPVASDWFFNLVKSIAGDRLVVKRSSIGDRPPHTSDAPPIQAYAMVKKAGKDWEFL